MYLIPTCHLFIEDIFLYIYVSTPYQQFFFFFLVQLHDLLATWSRGNSFQAPGSYVMKEGDNKIDLNVLL